MAVHISLSQAAYFDAAVQESAPCGEDITFISKRNSTVGGLPSVVIAFQAEIKGEVVPVQYVATLRELLMAATALAAHHDSFDTAWQNADRPRFGIIS